MAEPTLTAGSAERHETLILKLEALLTELRPLAARHPASPVPGSLATLGVLGGRHRLHPQHVDGAHANG